MSAPEWIEAFRGIEHTWGTGGDLADSLATRDALRLHRTGGVILDPRELHAIALRIQELQAIVEQNVLGSGDLAAWVESNPSGTSDPEPVHAGILVYDEDASRFALYDDSGPLVLDGNAEDVPDAIENATTDEDLDGEWSIMAITLPGWLNHTGLDRFPDTLDELQTTEAAS